VSGNNSRQTFSTPTLAGSMTAFPYTIETAASLDDARLLMRQHRIRHLPVMEGGQLLGVISDRDIKLGLAVGAELREELGDPTVGDVCSDDVYQVDIHTPLQVVVEHMASHHQGSAVVLRHAKVVGVFTATDACRCLAELLDNSNPDGDEAA